MNAKNTLYYGDNLKVLREHLADESVDLVYLDPPFNSNADYNVLFSEKDGTQAASQIKAFGDTWHWDQAAAADFQNVVESGGRPSQCLQAFRTLLGENDMLAYLSMMAPRLIELRRVLKETGSIYLHCDPTASHYLKLLLDSVFGLKFYRNEIIWKRTSAHNDPSKYGRIHDTILYYAKGEKPKWNKLYTPYTTEYIDAEFKLDKETGRLVKYENLTAPSHGRDKGRFNWRGVTPPPSRMWSCKLERLEELYAAGRIKTKPDGMPIMRGLKTFLEDLPGVPLQSIWTDLGRIGNTSGERLGYPTQKPEVLLERMVQTSSNEGDTVLDPFCGCGTAIAAAQKLDRRWIGIDITHLAISLIKYRLSTAFGDDIDKTYKVIGEPEDVQGAAQLAADDQYQFQWWALSLVHARPAEQKKGADKGIDGRLYFHDEGAGGKTKQVIFSVKAGHTSVPHVRDLRGVLDREKAQIGVLLTMEEPTKPMRVEAASAGFYASPGWQQNYPRLQILTVGELLAGKRVEMPPIGQVNVTFKAAPKAKGKATSQSEMFSPE